MKNSIEITVNANLANSAKKAFIKDYNLAFATGNAEFIIEHASDNIHWLIYGDKDIHGKDQFTKEVHAMKEYTADAVTIHSIITHGSEAACNGEMRMGDRTYAFCDVYQFSSASSLKIKEMRSYVLPI